MRVVNDSILLHCLRCCNRASLFTINFPGKIGLFSLFFPPSFVYVFVALKAAFGSSRISKFTMGFRIMTVLFCEIMKTDL